MGDFEKINVGDIPKDDQGRHLVDVYVHMPSNDRYVRFVASGDVFSESRQSLLQRHAAPNLYVKWDELQQAKKMKEEVEADPLFMVIKGDANIDTETFKIEVIGKSAEKVIKDIFNDLSDPNTTPAPTLEKIQKQSDAVVEAIAPDTKVLKAAFMSNAKYLMLMNDASAITSLAIMVAAACGYDSKKSYKDIAYACMIMDLSMAEFSDQEVETYYRDRTKMDPETLTRFKNHPIKSYQLAEAKLKSLGDVTKQLILSHHELYNGRGYPRSVKSESLFPMVKILALAVDIFEGMKSAELNGKPLLFPVALEQFKNESVEPHARRHSKKLVDQVWKYLEMERFEQDLLAKKAAA